MTETLSSGITVSLVLEFLTTGLLLKSLLSILILRCTYTVVYINTSAFYYWVAFCIVWIVQFAHSLLHGHFGCFQFGCYKISSYKTFVGGCVFFFFPIALTWIPKSGLAGYGVDSVCLCSRAAKLSSKAVVHHLYSPAPRNMWELLAALCSQYTILSFFLALAILVDMCDLKGCIFRYWVQCSIYDD